MNMKAPKLRFPEFSNAYSNRRIANITTRVANPVSVENGVEYTEIGIRSHGRGIFQKDKTTNVDIGNKRVFWIEPNLFIVNIVFAWEQAVAVTSMSEVGKIASHRFPMFKAIKNEISIEYLHRFFLTKKGKHLLGLASPGGAGRNRTLGQKEFDKLKLKLPTTIEQDKITNFLSSVDKKISLLKQKHEELVQYKKGVLQQLFSQQLRFKDDNGSSFPDWELNPLSEFIVRHEEKTTISDQYPVFTSSRKGLYFQADYYKKQVASEDNSGYNVVPRGYFTYRHMSDDLVFKFNINNLCDKGIVSTLYPVFTTKNIDDRFLQLKLNEGDEFKRFAIIQKQGGSRTYMYLNKLVKLKLKTPSLKEQEKIMIFIVSVDKKINLAQQQIEQTQAYKQGLLQQMFV